MDDWLSRDRIRTITTVVEEGNFSRAAAVLGVGQAAIGLQVRRLEAELGHRLFERTKRGLVLTGSGEAYLMFARAMIDLGEAARRHFEQPRVEGALRLGVAEEFTRSLLLGVLAAFKRAFPRYELSVVCDASHRLLAAADEGGYDIVVTKAPVSRGRVDVIRRVPLAWVGPLDLRRPVPDPVPLVLFPQPDPYREFALRALREAGRTWHVQFETSSLTALEAAVAAGFGVSVVGRPLPLHGIGALDPSVGLPALPDMDLVLLCTEAQEPGDAGVLAMRSIIQSAFDRAPEGHYRPASGPRPGSAPRR